MSTARWVLNCSLWLLNIRPCFEGPLPAASSDDCRYRRLLPKLLRPIATESKNHSAMEEAGEHGNMPVEAGVADAPQPEVHEAGNAEEGAAGQQEGEGPADGVPEGQQLQEAIAAAAASSAPSSSAPSTSQEYYAHACAKRGLAPFAYISDQLASAVPGAPLELDARGNAQEIKATKRRLNALDLEAVGETLSAYGLPLVALHVSHNDLGDAGAKVVAVLAQTNPLQLLDLAACGIGPEGAVAIASSLVKNAGFHSLVLDANGIEDAGGAAMAQLIQSHPNLQHLSLCRCELGIDSLIRISAALEVTAVLQHLDVSEPRLSSRNNEATYHIAKALRVNRSLRSLSLRKHPYFTDASVESLCDFLQDNEGCILELDLSSNKIAGPGGVSLAKAMESGALSVRRLKLSHCRIGDEGARALSDVLIRGYVLEELDLRHNSIGDSGLAALADAVCTVREAHAIATLGLIGGLSTSQGTTSKPKITMHAGPGTGPAGQSAGASGPPPGTSPVGILRIGGNLMQAGSIAAEAVGRVLMAGATTTAFDVRAYVVDGAMNLALDE